MSGSTPWIGLLSMDFHVPASNSLKEKRRVLKSLKDRIRGRFNVSVAEIDGLDTWQRSTVGVTMISTDKIYLEQNLAQVLRLAEQIDGLQLLTHQVEFL